MYGIDISKHNGNIDLTPYKGQFVIMRVGYGNFTLDKKFKRNVEECKRLGIPFGVYHYSYALNAETAKKEAQAVLKAIEPYRNDIKVGVWFDMEDGDGYKRKNGFKFNHDTIAPICYAFCKIIEDAGGAAVPRAGQREHGRRPRARHYAVCEAGPRQRAGRGDPAGRQ